MAIREVYERADGKWAWRLKSNNGQIIATDGGQGYENEDDAQTMVDSITYDEPEATDGHEGKWYNVGNGNMVPAHAVLRRASDPHGPVPSDLENWVNGEEA